MENIVKTLLVNRKILLPVVIIISLYMSFNYKAVNKKIDKILNIKRNKKNIKNKFDIRKFLYLIPVIYIIATDFYGDIVLKDDENLLTLIGMKPFIAFSEYILKIFGGYGIVQVLAQDLGVKTGIEQRDLIQHPISQFLLCWGGAYALSGTVSQGFLATLLYFCLRNNVSNGDTSNVCFEDV